MAKIISISILCVLAFSFFSKIEDNHKGCPDFRKGKFLYRGTEDTVLYLIERDEKVQLETRYDTRDNVTLKINWLDSCEYELSFLKQDIKKEDTITSEFQSIKINCKMQKFENDTCELLTSFEFRNTKVNLSGKLIKLH